MEFTRCLGCMEEKRQHPICEHCGYDERTENDAHQLPVGTILRGQYLIGRVLGQGGFGITYLGWDLNLDMPVAIKEYFPTGLVTRDVSANTDVTSYQGTSSRSYEDSKNRFLLEGRSLARFSQLHNVVKIHSLFPENNTAYLVMEYLRGQTLQQYLDDHGTLSLPQTMAFLIPLMKDLQIIHDSGTIHRDISPDNIMILPDGSAKLLDFGTVRQSDQFDANGVPSKSTEAILKQGFAPIEQYNSRGSLGPWTDVYALCATICYCLNRKLPQIAPDRVYADDPDHFIDILPIEDRQKLVLKKGMALRPQERTDSVKHLLEQFQTPSPGKPAPAKPVTPSKGSKAPGKKAKKLLVLFLPLAAVLILVLCLTLFRIPEKQQVSVPETLPAEPAASGSVPTAALPETTVSADPQEIALPSETAAAVSQEGWAPAEDRIWKRTQNTDAAFGSQIPWEFLRGIEFLDSLETAPEDALDVSQSGNGKVLLWPSEDQEGRKLLTIAAAGPVIFPEDCSFLFSDVHNQPQDSGADPYVGSTNLQYIRFHDAVDTGRVQTMRGMFSGCGNLKSVDLSVFDTSRVTDMSQMFSDCFTLEQADLSGFRTSQVTDMSRMFSDCASLSSLDLSHLDTSGAFNMQEMFQNCSRLKELDLSCFDTSGVTDMGGMFLGCQALTHLDLSGWDSSAAADFRGMFEGCKSLPQLDLSGFHTPQAVDMARMFHDCRSLQALDLSQFDTSSVTDMNNMFSGCDVISILDLSSFDTSETVNMSSMFKGCKALLQLDLSGFRTSETTDFSSMFEFCKSLSSLDLSGFRTEKALTMSSMFCHCSQLQSLDLSGFRTSQVTDMSLMFAGCKALISLDLSHFDTSSVTDMVLMFCECSSLETLDLGTFSTASCLNTPANIFSQANPQVTVITENPEIAALASQLRS